MKRKLSSQLPRDLGIDAQTVLNKCQKTLSVAEISKLTPSRSNVATDSTAKVAIDSRLESKAAPQNLSAANSEQDFPLSQLTPTGSPSRGNKRREGRTVLISPARKGSNNSNDLVALAVMVPASSQEDDRKE